MIIVLLPVFLLLLAAVAIVVLEQVRPGYGTAWLTALGITLAAWILVLVLRWYQPMTFIISGWRPVEGLVASITFQLDLVSWPYAFALVSLALGIILTTSVRMSATHPSSWAGSLAIASAALLAVLSGNALTLILAWTVIDFVELAVMLANSDPRQAQQAVISFAARLAGTLAAFWALLVSISGGSVLTLTNIPADASIYLLAAAGLRLGVVPLYLPYTQEIRMRRGLGTILRLAAPAAALPLLSRVPATVVPPQWAPYFLLFTTLAALYGSAMWLASKDELQARPYWLIALAGFAVGGAIRGHPESTVAWGAALLLCGGVLFLYSARHWRLLFVLLFAFLGLTGLPFTPAASGWSGLVVLPFNVLDILTILSHALLLAGFARHAFRPGDAISGSERWVRVMYPLGLVFLTVSFWIIGFAGRLAQMVPLVWWAAIASTVLAVLLYIGVRRTIGQGEGEGKPGWLSVVGSRIGAAVSAFLRLDWLYAFFGWLYSIVQSIVQVLAALFEGAGGMLWALLMLALLFMLVKSGGVR